MKRRDLTTLAMLGISAGLMLGGCQDRVNNNKLHALGEFKPTEQQVQNFYNSLSAENQKKFDGLDAQYKLRAIQSVHACSGPDDCPGKNSCKGLGACKTSAHDCAGQNDCKGQGGSPINDPNDSVERQYKNQEKERGKLKDKNSAPSSNTAPK